MLLPFLLTPARRSAGSGLWRGTWHEWPEPGLIATFTCRSVWEAGSDADMIDWSKLEAPSLAELEAIAEEAYARLPARFRALTGDLLIRVEDFPTDEVLDSSTSNRRSICSASIPGSILRERA